MTALDTRATPKTLSALAHGLIEEAYRDMGPLEPVDHHVHIAGLGTPAFDQAVRTSTAATWLHPDFRTWRHPYRRLQAEYFLRAAGVRHWETADADYIRSLAAFGGRIGRGTFMLCALDWRYERPPDNSSPNRERTDLFVGNDYVIELAARLSRSAVRNERYLPVASVQPYRRDAIDAVTMLAEKGVRYVKWLPPAQNIDPADRSLRPFYQALQRLRIRLLSHTGDEHTLRVRDEDQDLANPARLALALDEGVTVVMLHAGRDGSERAPGPDGKRRSYADRFIEMMKRYPSNAFGEISVVPYLGTHTLLQRLMDDPEICRRLVNGSDYPWPAVIGGDPTGALMRAGYLSDPTDRDTSLARRRRKALLEIRRTNPLLFDFVLKRTLRIGGRKLPMNIFHAIDSNVLRARAK